MQPGTRTVHELWTNATMRSPFAYRPVRHKYIFFVTSQMDLNRGYTISPQ
jgi:hypothetical protein